jgi:hypothetical protein
VDSVEVIRGDGGGFVYSHVLPSMGEQVADAMQAALGASGSKSGSKP